jgi:EmrB/QacA subfamily drug resistance transporter
MTDSRPVASRAALTLLCVAGLLAGLDFMIMNVALPAIQQELGMSAADLQWVVSAYALAFGGFLLLGGRLADLFGGRRLFIAGFVLFAIASLIGGLVEDGLVLITARAGQGLGAALLVPAALALIASLYAEGSDRNRALGLFAGMQAFGSTLGLIAGGLLVDGPGWQWVMLVNVPIGIAAVVAAPRLLPGSPAVDRGGGFDLAGALLVTTSLVVLLYAVVGANDHGWGSTRTVGLIVAAVVGLAAFLLVEGRAANPLVPPGYLRRLDLAGSNLVAFLLTASAWSLFFVLTLYMQLALGWRAVETGLAYVPMGVTIFLVARYASPIAIARLGPRPTLGLALALNAAALVWLAGQLIVGGDYLANLVAPMLVLAVANGLGNATAIVAALEGVRPDEQGLASGMVSTALQIGGAFGVAILVSVASATSGLQPSAAALVDGYQAALITGAGLAALGSVIAWALALTGRRRTARSAAPVPPPAEGPRGAGPRSASLSAPNSTKEASQ